MKTCPLCNTKFKPWKGQKTAYWTINWCTTDSGKLCPACYKAAEELGGLFDKAPLVPETPWGSDIVKASKKATEEQYKDQRSSENLKNWM